MKIAVHGSGYVGLVTAACFASMGNDVLCIDIDADRIEELKGGRIPIRENGLQELVGKTLKNGSLRFSSSPEDGVAHATLQFIAVGTPPGEDGSADLQHVLAVANSIATYMEEPRIIVNKSTVPVGTADKVSAIVSQTLAERGSDIEFDVISNPEFLKEGAAVEDFMKPDRIILGAKHESTIKLMRELYRPFTRQQDRMIVMPVRDAEFTKYAANTMLATRISLMNEFANIAERLGVDIESVRRGIGTDPRIGPAFLYAGCGYGGSCFPKDVAALRRTAEQEGYEPLLLAATEQVNARQKRLLLDKVSDYFGEQLAGRTIAVWGLAFKAGTDDMREASSRVLLEGLWDAGVTVRAYDPAAMPEMLRIYGERPDLVLCESRDAALENADALVICTEWKEFRSPDFDRIRRTLGNAVIFDGRNLYEPSVVSAAGIEYHGIGRPAGG
ncbi:MAG: UDP-glucose/GDP-mannose dehydrogenase family protein [Gammaproteobacteria bacterium]|nr:UDP-glucose/GDP-mannose dehydrogenase family protein [Gammaproteobacteria bacterium]